MHHTVKTGTHVRAQGTFVRRHGDGRIEINLGDRHVIGWPLNADTSATRQPNVIARLFGTSHRRSSSAAPELAEYAHARIM